MSLSINKTEALEWWRGRVHQQRKSNIARCCFFYWAGPQGIEPWSALLERDILPLNYRPVSEDSNIKMNPTQLCNRITFIRIAFYLTQIA